MSRSSPSAGALAIGDELLEGAHPDLNSPFVARALAEYGWTLGRAVTVADQEHSIAEAVEELAAQHGLVVVSGGLGPTLDDVTRHGIARGAQVPIERNEQAAAQVRAWYELSGRRVPDSNERQALLPRGARILLNSYGTAPGFHLAVGGSQVFALPGPPTEFQPMVEDHLLPWLRSNVPDGLVRRVQRFYLFNLSESAFADAVGPWMGRSENPLMGVTAGAGVLSVRLIAKAGSEEQARSLLEQRSTLFRERFGDHVLSEEEPDPGRILGAELLARDLEVTTAESCTGGLVAAALTDVPGISRLFREGIVTYSNEAKIERLGVEASLIAEHGAVSGPVAEAMARGAAERTGAHLALATTGIAGPGGGSEHKPVGLVWFGVHFDGQTRSVERRWPPAGRDRIRRWATSQALTLGLRSVRGLPLG